MFQGFIVLWNAGWRGKLTVVKLIASTALASALGRLAEYLHNARKRLEGPASTL